MSNKLNAFKKIKKETVPFVEELSHDFDQAKANHANTINKYENVITHIEILLKQCMAKNKYLIAEKGALLRENYQLKKQIEQFQEIEKNNNFIKRRYYVNEGQLFKKIDTMKQWEQCIESERDISKQSNQSSSHSQYQKKQQRMAEYNNNPIGFVEEQFSLNENYCTQQINDPKTPALPETSSRISCTSMSAEGVLRAFYMSIMQFQSMRKMLGEIINSLNADETYVIYDLYPTNQFWTDMLKTLVELIGQNELFLDETQLIDHINQHKFIDFLFIQCLKSRIAYVNMEPEFFNKVEILQALCTEFNLWLQTTNQGSFVFYEKSIERQEYLLNDSEGVQLSLNNQGCQYFSKQNQSLFTIYNNEDKNLLQFRLRLGYDNCSQQVLSQYQIKSQNFNCNDEIQGGSYEGSEQINYVTNILNTENKDDQYSDNKENHDNFLTPNYGFWPKFNYDTQKELFIQKFRFKQNDNNLESKKPKSLFRNNWSYNNYLEFNVRNSNSSSKENYKLF